VKKAILLSGIIAWSILGLIILGILIVGLSGSGAPGWVQNLPGYSRLGGDGSFAFNIGRNTSMVKEESFPTDGLNGFNLHTSHQRISVTVNNGENLTIRQYDGDNAVLFSTDIGGGILTVRTDPKFTVMIGINISPHLEISVPRSYEGTVSLNTSSGSVRIEEGVAWGDTSIKTSSGSVRINAPSSFGALRIKTSSGSIRSGDINGGDITAESSSGSQTFGTLSAEGSVSLTASSGSVKANAVHSERHQIRTKSGSIRIGELTGEGDVRSNSGSVKTGDAK
jgi:hypothetical protein